MNNLRVANALTLEHYGELPGGLRLGPRATLEWGRQFRYIAADADRRSSLAWKEHYSENIRNR